jgi:hypothetical protein
MVRIRTFTAPLVGLTLTCCACQNPAIQHEWVRREANIDRTIGYLIQSEERRPENLAQTARMIEDQEQRDVENTLETNPARIKEWTDFEFERWEARQPLYRQRIDEQLGGNLQSIERTIPYIFN